MVGLLRKLRVVAFLSVGLLVLSALLLEHAAGRAVGLPAWIARQPGRENYTQNGAAYSSWVTSIYAGLRCIMRPASCGREIQLLPPSTGMYMLDHPEQVYFSQFGQERKLWDPVLAPIDGLRQRGYKPFFVESGARDGEVHSNTLFLERNQSWQGLLVEPSDIEFPNITQKGRRCWAFHGAISPTKGPAVLHFSDDGMGTSHFYEAPPMSSFLPWVGLGHLDEESQAPVGESVTRTRTLAEPLEALLSKVRPPVSTVDFWSLDIEGSEGRVLESTDFSRVEVGVLMIEMNKGLENDLRIQAVMDANGFQDIGGTTYPDGILDHVFVNPAYFVKRGLAVPYLIDGFV